MRRECRERFPRHRLQRKPQVCDPVMHLRHAVAGKTFPTFPAHAQPAILRFWKEAHGLCRNWSLTVSTTSIVFLKNNTCYVMSFTFSSYQPFDWHVDINNISTVVNTLRVKFYPLTHQGHNIFKWIFLDGKKWILVKFVHNIPNDNKLTRTGAASHYMNHW